MTRVSGQQETPEKCYIVYSYLEDGNLAEDDLYPAESFDEAKQLLKHLFTEQYKTESSESDTFDTEESRLNTDEDAALLSWNNGLDIGMYRILHKGTNCYC